MNILAPMRTYGRTEERLMSLFLSATVRDMGDYRARIPEWTQHFNINVNPHKYWSGAAEPIEQLCTRRISSCSGYIGVFGYRYGWRPPGRERSITHIEFDHAMLIWKGRSTVPPIFLFLPTAGSVAAQQLKKLADDVLANEFKGDEAEIKSSRTKQENLLRRIAELGRLVNDFASLDELRERIATSLFHYHTTLLDGLAEAESTGARALGIPPTQLGQIGRDKQLQTIKSILFGLASQPAAPGAFIVVRGQESGGLAEFIELLNRWKGWGRTARVRVCPSDDDLAKLVAWVRRAIDDTEPTESNPFDALAQGIARRGEHELLVVIIKQRRGWQPERFQAQFWRPLHDRLLSRRSASGNRSRFVLVRVFAQPIGPDEAQLMQACEPAQANFDWTRALLLPPCEDLTEQQVASWLMSDELGLDLDQAARVAKDAVHRNDGVIDGTPLHVFDRLRADGFWEKLTAGFAP
jgi:Domain of unknown function (DUF4062)